MAERPWWLDDPTVEVGSKSGPIPGWPTNEQLLNPVVPPVPVPEGEDEDRADSEVDPGTSSP